MSSKGKPHRPRVTEAPIEEQERIEQTIKSGHKKRFKGHKKRFKELKAWRKKNDPNYNFGGRRKNDG